MANGGKDIRLGDDKRPVTIIPQSEDNLYNVRNGEILTDEFGIPLTTEIEEIFVPDATTKRATSIVFPEKPEDFKNIVKNEPVGIVTATYGHDLDVYVSTRVAQTWRRKCIFCINCCSCCWWNHHTGIISIRRS